MANQFFIIILLLCMKMCNGMEEWTRPVDGRARLVTGKDGVQTIVIESPTEGTWEIGNGEIWHLQNKTNAFKPISTEHIEMMMREVGGVSIREPEGHAIGSIRPGNKYDSESVSIRPTASSVGENIGSIRNVENFPSGSIRTTNSERPGSIRPQAGGSIRQSPTVGQQSPASGSIRVGDVGTGLSHSSISETRDKPSGSIRSSEPIHTTNTGRPSSIRPPTGGSIRQSPTFIETQPVSGSIRCGDGGVQLSSIKETNVYHEMPSGSIRGSSVEGSGMPEKSSSIRPNPEYGKVIQSASGSIRPSVTGPASGDAKTSPKLKAKESGKVIYIKERNQHFLKRHDMISKDGNHSIGVYDVFDNEKVQCGRVLFVDKGLDIDHMDSYIVLTPAPNSPSTKIENVRQCANMLPNHQKIPLLYIVAMISIPYILHENFDQKKNEILSIGLGGGSIDMFFHTKQAQSKIDVVELNPMVIEAATNWFGVTDTEMHKLHEDDGIKYIKNAVAKGTHYDAIFIDACDNDMCPTKDFLDILPNIKMILKDDGVAIFNVIAIAMKNNKLAVQNALKKIKKNFTSCVPIAVRENTVIGCTMVEKNAWPDLLQMEKTLKNQLMRYGEKMTPNIIKKLQTNFSHYFTVQL